MVAAQVTSMLELDPVCRWLFGSRLHLLNGQMKHKMNSAWWLQQPDRLPDKHQTTLTSNHKHWILFVRLYLLGICMLCGVECRC